MKITACLQSFGIAGAQRAAESVGNTGFEPVTFSMSRKRANQLRQLPEYFSLRSTYEVRSTYQERSTYEVQSSKSDVVPPLLRGRVQQTRVNRGSENRGCCMQLPRTREAAKYRSVDYFCTRRSVVTDWRVVVNSLAILAIDSREASSTSSSSESKCSIESQA